MMTLFLLRICQIKTILYFPCQMYSKAAAVTSKWEKKISVYTVEEKNQYAYELFKCIDMQLCDYEEVRKGYYYFINFIYFYTEDILV